MHTTKVIKNFTETELQKNIDNDASWHQDYKDSAYIFIGGLHFDMNEGDVSTVFSQYGELVDVRLMRDRKTGKSRGFGFVAYEDQRSTVLAVDNFNGVEICGRTIRVDHVKKFKPPKEFLEVKEGDEGQDVDDEEKIYKPSGPDGRGWGEFRDYTEEELTFMKMEEERAKNAKNNMNKLYEKNEQTMIKIFLDEDERWENMLMSRVEEEEDQRETMRKDMMKKIKKEMKKRKKLESKMQEDEGEGKKKKKKEKKEKKEKKNKKEKKADEDRPRSGSRSRSHSEREKDRSRSREKRE